MDARAIAVENLHVKGMVKNHKLAKSVSDASMSEMIRQLEYKSRWYNRPFVRVDRWYPSSKTCHVCSYVYKGLKLEERSWTCPECGAKHDRDVNAAINIANEGRRLLNS
jgi:putative transposase